MKSLFWILGAIALVLVLGGVLNHETDVSLDFLVGSALSVSLFWLAVAAAVVLVLAGLAGWAVGQAGTGDARGKLERELETTYRRLRECEARLPQTPPAPADETVTAVAPAPADEAVTVVAPASVDEAVTAVTQTPADEAATAVTPAPDDEVETAEPPAQP